MDILAIIPYQETIINNDELSPILSMLSITHLFTNIIWYLAGFIMPTLPIITSIATNILIITIILSDNETIFGGLRQIHNLFRRSVADFKHSPKRNAMVFLFATFITSWLLFSFTNVILAICNDKALLPILGFGPPPIYIYQRTKAISNWLRFLRNNSLVGTVLAALFFDPDDLFASPTRLKAYDILEVPVGSNKADIRRAYLKKAREFHPDSHPNDSKEELEAFTKKFQTCQNAYDLLIA